MNENKTLEPCDGCGREVRKITRVYRGERFCSSCYKRIFLHKICPECGEPARLSKDYPAAICQKCENSKPCIRCGQSGRPVGKVTNYGPVCNSCAKYFREEKECAACGRSSRYVATVIRDGVESVVCIKCATTNQGTCQACHRYRRLFKSQNGLLLCKTCLEQGEVECPECGNLMPAGSGKRCRDCYLKALLGRRIQINCEAFTTPEMAEHYRSFGKWLGISAGSHNAALSINGYLPFFMEIERLWGNIPEYRHLLSYFGPEKLRGSLRAVRWMEDAGLIERDQKAKSQESERRQIDKLLERFEWESLPKAMLAGYYHKLQKKMESGKTSLRSVRLALKPAVELLDLEHHKMGFFPPTQKTLDRYLFKTPGQRTAVSGFVKYLNDCHGIDIKLPTVDRQKQRDRQRIKLEQQLFNMMRHGLNGEREKRKWVNTALAFFHKVPKTVCMAIPESSLKWNDDGSCSVLLGGEVYWVPTPELPKSPKASQQLNQSKRNLLMSPQ